MNFENYRRVVGEVYHVLVESCHLFRENVGVDSGREVNTEVDKRSGWGSE